MKKLFLILVTILLLNCEKDKPRIELEKLPPATQVGANTVGCLLDGKAFMRGYYNNSTNCFYQFVDGGYYFVAEFNNKDPKSNLTALAVGTQKIKLVEGTIYKLVEFSEYNAYGAYTYNTDDNCTTYTHTGELKITKLDQVKGIVSGTFWYDVEDQNGIVHQIRNGRFDMRYTN